MNTHYVYRPARFFFLTFLLSWLPWICAAILSYQNGMDAFVVLLELLGMFGPMFAALILILSSNNDEPKRDFRDRLLNFRRMRFSPSYVLALFVLVPATMLLSTFFSLFLGGSSSQFQFSAGLANMLAIILLASTFEELGWRGYGMDSLRSKSNLFTATLLFSCLWALWHLPLFFINHTYQNGLWSEGIIYVLNFFVSVLPAAILINWLYYRNNRSTLVAILLHMNLNLTSEALKTESLTKCIMTVILLIISFIVILTNKAFFFGGEDAVMPTSFESGKKRAQDQAICSSTEEARAIETSTDRGEL